MKIGAFSIITTIINIGLLIAIIVGLYKIVNSIKSFINRNKELDKKIDIILNKLDNKDGK